jgi:type I restriction enzyme M protein
VQDKAIEIRWQALVVPRIVPLTVTMSSLRPAGLANLESHLWEAANILRGPVDAADFKTYIFPLLFFKRICDVWDEERGELASELGEAAADQIAEAHRFQIPEGCHWSDVREKASNVGAALQRSMREIERANTETLYGVFGDAQWTNKERLSDSLLKDLIEHFSRLSLGNQAVNSDVMGDAYEYLIKKFADAQHKKAGEFYTPRSIVRLMVDIIDPKAGESIYDPACGTGGMLLGAVQHVKEHNGDTKRLRGRLYGQEKNLTTSAIARMNLFLHGMEDFKIVRGDTLRNPAFHEGDALAEFECVIANPPFSLKKWGEEVWTDDPWGRSFAGTPPASYGDYAWVQHMIKSLAPGRGRMAVVLSHGALFRMGREGKIRRKILMLDQLDSVIGLGKNLFYGAGLAACIMVFRSRKPESHKEKVLFIDASKELKAGRAQNELTPEQAKRILGWYAAFADVEGVARVVSLAEIESKEFSLNIPRYLAPKSQMAVISVEEAMHRLKEGAQTVSTAGDRLVEVLRQQGFVS